MLERMFRGWDLREGAVNKPTDITALARCLMGPSDIIVKATIKLSHGLSRVSKRGLHGRKDISHAFPEGSLKHRPVPAKRLAGVSSQDHESAGPKEIVASDTIFSGEPSAPMAQIFVDYISRMIDIFPMPRRTHVPRTLLKFCARWWTPIVFLCDGASENTSLEMETICIERNISQIFRTPGQTSVAIQNFSEPAIGHITRRATYALVFSGGTIRYWILATEAACFVDRITAHWYKDLNAFSTPLFPHTWPPFP